MTKNIFSKSKEFGKRRGPPTLLADQELLHRREDFVKVFESLWGEIGWGLQKCKQETDIGRALGPLNKFPISQKLASVFVGSSAGYASTDTVRDVRARLRNIQQRRWDAEISKQRAIEEFQRVNGVIAQATSSKRRLIERVRNERQKEASIRSKEWQELSRLQEKLERQLRGLEARFARQEILRFCKSKRYELTPLSLANASAGLPYMGWRQSMRRSIKQPSVSANGLEYQIFKAIRFIASQAKKNSEKVFVAEFRENIPQLPNRYRASKGELEKEWFFLDRALRGAFKSKPHPRAFPFEISKRYFKQIRSRSQVDRILAQQAELTLKKVIEVPNWQQYTGRTKTNRGI